MKQTPIPLISVITVTYNAANVLSPTLKSLECQTFRDFEHLIIDGGSNDGTLAIARKHPNIRILSEKDNGLYDAMNKGLDMARGRYVIFLNAGDSFHAAETLGNYAKAALQNNDIIYGDTIIVDASRSVIGPRHLQAPSRLTDQSFADGMLICHQAFMVKKSLAPKYNLTYRFSSDYDWTLRCIDASDSAKRINLNSITIDYLKDGMTDRNKIASLKERYHIMSNRYGFLPTLLRHFKFLYRSLLCR